VDLLEKAFLANTTQRINMTRMWTMWSMSPLRIWTKPAGGPGEHTHTTGTTGVIEKGGYALRMRASRARAYLQIPERGPCAGRARLGSGGRDQEQPADTESRLYPLEQRGFSVFGGGGALCAMRSAHHRSTRPRPRSPPPLRGTGKKKTEGPPP
jgi:hypothetical protein